MFREFWNRFVGPSRLNSEPVVEKPTLVEIPWFFFPVQVAGRHGSSYTVNVSHTTIVFSEDNGVFTLEDTRMVDPDFVPPANIRLSGQPDIGLYPAVMIRSSEDRSSQQPDEVLICLALAEKNPSGTIQPVFDSSSTGPRIRYYRYEGAITLTGSWVYQMKDQLDKLIASGRQLAYEVRSGSKILIYSTDPNQPLLGVSGLVVVIEDPTSYLSPISVNFKLDSRELRKPFISGQPSDSLTLALPTAQRQPQSDPERTLPRPRSIDQQPSSHETTEPITQIASWAELMQINPNHPALQNVYRSPGPGEAGPVELAPATLLKALRHLGKLVYENNPDEYDASLSFRELPRSFGREHVLMLFNQERRTRNLPEFKINYP